MNATPKEYNGITYRSTLEARCAKMLDENRIPFGYETIKIEYIPSFKYCGKTFRKAQYSPDFIIDDKYILEVKGFPNNIWTYKKKLILLELMKTNHYSFYEIHSLAQLKRWMELYKTNNLNEQNEKDFI